MANGGEDHIHFEASFGELDADVARVKAILEEQLVKAEALGDQALQARVRSQLAHPALTGKTQIDESTAALARQGEQLAKNTQLNLFNLELLQQQAEFQAQLNAVRAAERPGQLSFAPQRQEPLVVTPAGPTQAMVAAEAAAAQEQQRVNELARAEAVARAEALRVEEEQIAADRARGEALVEYQARLNAITRRQQEGYAAGAAAARQGLPLTSRQQEVLTTPPAGIKGWSAEYGKMALVNAELGKYDTYATKASVSSQRLTANLTRLGIADAEASNQLRRHGALTTEFLGALARGETTVNEFGYQIGATIGKFAGWTAAATATYGALGAVAEFGKGAFDASSGVQQLTRTIDNLDREKATQAITGLSADVNVPIKQAADAIFVFSRSFHDLTDATLAAKLALSAYKLDGVQVTDTVKAMTAIHQQFGLSVQQQVPIFDELAQGQQKFNARMNEQIPLLQRSASAVKNAGGDLREFIELSTIALRTTQLSGPQLGTAFLRSAATFLNPATTKGQADRSVLTGLGIDVNQGYTSVIKDALQKAATLSPSDRQKLSLAVFGPLLGGRTAGFFTGGPSLLGPVGRDLSPAGAKGTLEVELARELGTAREKLHAFINEMQRTGAAIGDSGLVPFFTLLVRVLTAVGSGVRDIVEIFDGLPGVLKETITGLVLLRGAMLFLNRTRFGASFGGLSRVARIPGLDPTFAEQQARAQLATGTRAAMQVLEDNIARSVAASITNGGEQVALERRRAEIQRQILAEGDRTGELKAESNSLDERIEALNRQQIDIERTKNAQLEALAGLKQQQVALTATSRNVRATGPEVIAFGTTVKTSGLDNAAAQNAAVTSEDAAAQVRLQAGKLAQARAYVLDADATRAATAATAEATTAARVDASALTLDTLAAGRSAGRMAALGAGIGKFGAGLAGLVAALDPITIALVGIPLVLSSIQSEEQGLKDAAGKVSAVLHQGTPTLQGWQQIVAAVKSAPWILEQDQYAKAIHAYQEALGKQAEKFIQSAGLQRGVATALRGAISAAVRAARSISVLGGGDGPSVLSELQAAPLKEKVQTLQALADRVKIYGATNADLKRIAQIYAVIAAQFANSQNDADLQQVAQAQSLFIDAVRSTAQNLIDQAGATTNKHQKAALLRQAAAALSVGRAQVRIADAELVASMKAEAAAGASVISVIGSAGDAVAGAGRQIIGTLFGTASQVKRFNQVEAQITSGIDAGLQAVAAYQAQAAATATEKALKNATDTANAQLDQTLKQIHSGLASTKPPKPKKTPASQDPFELTRLQSELQQARDADDPVKAAQDAERLAQSEITAARNQHERLQAEIDLANAQHQLDQAIQDRTQAYYTYLASTTTDPLAQARFALQGAQQQVAFDAAHGGLNTAKALQDRAAANSALQQVDQAIEDRTQAYYTYLASTTSNPVKQARFALEGAQQQVSFDAAHGGLDTAKGLQDRAAANSAKRSLTQSIVDTDMQTLDFQLHTQRITDQQYIHGLQQLLKLKHLTLQQRQTILGQIFDASQQAAVDLNTGSIKLPTTYEVRRAILSAARRRDGAPASGGGALGSSSNTTNNTTNHVVNNINLHVTRDTDMRKVAKVLDDTLKTNLTTSAQAAQLV